MALVLRGLLQHVSITFAQDDPERASRGGWVFDTPEPIFGASDLRYARSNMQHIQEQSCKAGLRVHHIAGRFTTKPAQATEGGVQRPC